MACDQQKAHKPAGVRKGMKAILSMAVLAVLATAGCFGGDDEHKVDPVTCPDGTTLGADQIEAVDGHHHATFNATDHCPVAPSVSLEGIPASLQAFKTAAFRWTLDNGSIPNAHSMLTSIRYSSSSVPDRELTNLAKYPTEIIKREHQDIPISYEGNLSFAKTGKVFLRAYAQIAGADYWSPEVQINVTPVPSTGVVVDITHGPGDFTSPPTPAEVNAILGDSIRLVNEDFIEHTCSFTSGPAAVNALEAPAQGASQPVMLAVPGTYEFTCDELQPQSFTVHVALN